MEGHTRKYIRLKKYDYSSNGMYFITICAKNRNHYFSEITEDPQCVGEAALGLPNVRLTDIGKIVKNNIIKINDIYKYVSVEKYVIMPDHIHMILFISDYETENGGRPGAASPTNAVIPSLISVFKRFVNKKTGCNIWQRSYHDHIIRNEREFLEICNYIDNNPINWVNDIYNQNFWR